MSRWERLGRIFVSAGQRPWMQTHSTVPTPEHIRDHLYRIYFSPRDDQGRSHVGSLVVDMREPTRVLEIDEEPLLRPGELGAFDDSGAMFSWIVRHERRRWLYYIGWSLGVQTPWRTAIGLAFAPDGDVPGRFERMSRGPLLDRSTHNPFFVTNPHVIVEDGRWRMWYLSGTGWHDAGHARLPRYNVRHAESVDGVTWRTSEHICVDHLHPGEVAIGRPFVVKHGGRYTMYYSYRGDNFGYRLGCAESGDGLTWTRTDASLSLVGPPQHWDNEGTAYPTVFDHEGQQYMLYCGNHFSKGGFGIAARRD